MVRPKPDILCLSVLVPVYDMIPFAGNARRELFAQEAVAVALRVLPAWLCGERPCAALNPRVNSVNCRVQPSATQSATQVYAWGAISSLLTWVCLVSSGCNQPSLKASFGFVCKTGTFYMTCIYCQNLKGYYLMGAEKKYGAGENCTVWDLVRRVNH